MKKVKTKLLTIIISIALLTLLTGLISGIATNFKVLNNSMDATLPIIAEETSKNITADISKIGNGVIKMSTSSDFTVSSDTVAANNLISAAREEGIENISLYDTDGKFLKGTFECDIDIGTTPDFAEAVETGEVRYILPVQLSDDSYYYIMIVPVVKNGQVLRMLVSPFLYDQLNSVVENYTIGKNGEVYLINKEGVTLSNDNLANAVLGDPPEGALSEDKVTSEDKDLESLHQQFIKNTESEYIKKSIDGDAFVTGKSYSDTLGCFVVASMPQSEVFNFTPIIMLGGITAVCLVVIMFAISKILSKTVISPLRSSIERLKELADGNITDPVKVYNSHDEIGEMTRALDETVTSLRFYVSNISEKLNDIADGDLTDRMHGKFKGDFIKIKSTFNTILMSLIDTFGNINGSAEQVNSGASQVSNAAQTLSQGSTEQASSIEELSATIMEISTEIKNNAQSAKNATGIVTNNNEEIANCNNDMNKMLKAMDDISDSSYQISKIIKVIDDIAFQTNILALNAAVEAARAGSAGKGFAVVADEVRNLAEKSAQAAKQTTNLIKGSVDSVDSGTKIAKETAAALADIVKKSENINVIVKNISIASDKQADSIVQINSGIEQISGVIQNNTATAEESAAASEELSSQSQVLKNMVGKFKLGDKEKLFSSADSMVYSREVNSFDDNLTDAKKDDDEFAFDATVSDDSEDEFAFGGTASNDSKDDEFSFDATVSDGSQDDEFAFAGTVANDSEDDEFAFGGTASNDSQDDEFAFGGTIADDNSSIDDEDSKY